MTERPEERDVDERLAEGVERQARLDEIEERLATIERDQPHGQRLELVRDLRTLINEVKERETERAMWERASRNATSRILDLEAEVKELREDKHRATAVADTALARIEHLESRIKQMEEALREIAESCDRHIENTTSTSAVVFVLRGIARRALSPSGYRGGAVSEDETYRALVDAEKRVLDLEEEMRDAKLLIRGLSACINELVRQRKEA